MADNKLEPAGLTLTITKETTSEQAQSAVKSICVALRVHEQKIGVLRVLLGQLVHEIQRRELYRPDYPSFEKYTEALTEEFPVSRTVIRDALSFVKAFPKVTPEEAENIPVANMTLAASVAKNVEPAVARSILRDAGRLSIVGFRESLVEKELVAPRGRPDGGARKTGTVNLLIRDVPAKVAARFRERGGESQAKYLAKLLTLDPETE
jgi:hypothetical protein